LFKSALETRREDEPETVLWHGKAFVPEVAVSMWIGIKLSNAGNRVIKKWRKCRHCEARGDEAIQTVAWIATALRASQ
jgi:hypothetical protein